MAEGKNRRIHPAVGRTRVRARHTRRQIADIVSKYTKYNGRRKPELLDPDTFSLVNYQEADKVLADWKSITAEAEEIYQKLPENERDAFFELVLYPTKACEQVNELYIMTAKNRLYASQGRASANDYRSTGTGTVQGRCGFISVLQSHFGEWTVEPHDGSDAHRLHVLAAAANEHHARSH